ncbi:hypothetical protein IAU59_004788 [Kwoniella sp. CBS 9459]
MSSPSHLHQHLLTTSDTRKQPQRFAESQSQASHSPSYPLPLPPTEPQSQAHNSLSPGLAPLNRYIPQSPHPDSPPQTPSPSSESKPSLAFADTANANAVISSGHHTQTHTETMSSPAVDIPRRASITEHTPQGTPEGYDYNSPTDANDGGAGTGMGIQFPPESNPLPAELHSPERNGVGLGVTAPTPITVIDHNMTRVRSSEGLPAMHPNSIPSTSSSPAPQLRQGQTSGSNLHPSTSASSSSTPTRPRTVSPRPNALSHVGGHTGAAGTFTSSSSIGMGGLDGPRERVISPNKLDLNGGSASLGTFGENTTFDIGTGAGSANPYDPSHSNRGSWSAASGQNTFSAYGGNFPLTGKDKERDSLLGSSPTVHPTRVPFTDSVAYWLGLYFCFNLGLTLFNKFVLVSFPFPYTLTGLHALSGCAGTYIALEQGAFTPARLTQKENIILAAFSVLYTINIAVSNISLQLVSIPFHQVVRASTPLFTIFISAIFLRTKFSAVKLVSLLPVVAGVGFATYGDYDFTALGLILTLLGTFLAALKTVVTNLIQTGGGGRLRLHPLDLLMRMSPLAFIQCVIYGWYTGELERVRRYGATQMTRSKAIALLMNGVFAFGLNIVSFTANKKAGALTMTVSANCKQVLTIVLAVMLFNLHISPTNGVGILLTLVGGGWYGYVEYMEKKKKTKVLERA